MGVGRTCEVKKVRKKKERKKKERDGPPHQPLLQCLSALPGWLVLEPGVPLLLAPGPAPGLLCGYLAREASAISRPLFLPQPVRPDFCAPLPAPAPHLSALCFAGLCHLGSPAGYPPAIPVHLPQVRQHSIFEFLFSKAGLNSNVSLWRLIWECCLRLL